jgi:hypothetical protein
MRDIGHRALRMVQVAGVPPESLGFDMLTVGDWSFAIEEGTWEVCVWNVRRKIHMHIPIPEFISGLEGCLEGFAEWDEGHQYDPWRRPFPPEGSGRN